MRFSPKRVREARGSLTAVQAAFKISQHIKKPIGAHTIYAWESGKTVPNPNQFAAMVSTTDKSFHYFFADPEETAE